jgi:hypothetical protein
MKCKICSSESSLFASGVILRKQRISYFQCPDCGFIQTEEPYWLDEAYSSAITGSDVGLVRRNIMLSKQAGIILKTYFDRDKPFIDYGAGYGLFVRLMRDAGFDFYYYDKHCENIFSRDFEADGTPTRQYELLTAFEVFEHLADPVAEVAKMLSYSPNILFTTTLLPKKTPMPDDWWYYGPEHGQHISFYTQKALSWIAHKYSLNYYSDKRALHLFTARKISPVLFMLISNFSFAVQILTNRSTHIQADYKKITGNDI